MWWASKLKHTCVSSPPLRLVDCADFCVWLRTAMVDACLCVSVCPIGACAYGEEGAMYVCVFYHDVCVCLYVGVCGCVCVVVCVGVCVRQSVRVCLWLWESVSFCTCLLLFLCVSLSLSRPLSLSLQWRSHFDGKQCLPTWWFVFGARVESPVVCVILSSVRLCLCLSVSVCVRGCGCLCVWKPGTLHVSNLCFSSFSFIFFCFFVRVCFFLSVFGFLSKFWFLFVRLLVLLSWFLRLFLVFLAVWLLVFLFYVCLLLLWTFTKRAQNIWIFDFLNLWNIESFNFSWKFKFSNTQMFKGFGTSSLAKYSIFTQMKIKRFRKATKKTSKPMKLQQIKRLCFCFSWLLFLLFCSNVFSVVFFSILFSSFLLWTSWLQKGRPDTFENLNI